MQLHRDREKLAATGGDVVLLGMGRPEHARVFKQETGVDFPLLLSRDKAAYRAMDLERGSNVQVFDPRAMATGVVRTLGFGVGRAEGGNYPVTRPPQQDWHQLGGTFVVAPGGALVFEHRARHSGDNVSSGRLTKALAAAANS